jgi:hypothetical protein
MVHLDRLFPNRILEGLRMAQSKNMADAEQAEVAQPVAVAPESFRQLCECEFCRRGESVHHDDSHDHSLRYQFKFRNSNRPADGQLLPPLTLVNGCTKCARVTAWYLEGELVLRPLMKHFSQCQFAFEVPSVFFRFHSPDHPDLVSNLRVIELGAGTGLVAMAAALMGAKSSLLTDQVRHEFRDLK